MADVRVALVFPDLLGTYGDGGNARILAQRLTWRGIAAEMVTVPLGTPVPRTCELYVLGGGEDAPQTLAATELRAGGGLHAAVDAGAAVLAVCAGLQVIGTRFRTSEGLQEGVGIVDVDSVEGLNKRAVGELVVDPIPSLGLPRLSGYENHASITRLGPTVSPFGRVQSGVGNGTSDAVDGFVVGKVLGTYLHGPALARNPELADLLLGWIVGDLPPLERSDVDEDAFDLRRERLAAVSSVRRWRRS